MSTLVQGLRTNMFEGYILMHRISDEYLQPLLCTRVLSINGPSLRDYVSTYERQTVLSHRLLHVNHLYSLAFQF